MRYRPIMASTSCSGQRFGTLRAWEPIEPDPEPLGRPRDPFIPL